MLCNPHSSTDTVPCGIEETARPQGYRTQLKSAGAAGYEAEFVHSLLKRHECPICLFAMRNPVQTECGHLFCRACLEPVLQRR